MEQRRFLRENRRKLYPSGRRVGNMDSKCVQSVNN